MLETAEETPAQRKVRAPLPLVRLEGYPAPDLFAGLRILFNAHPEGFHAGVDAAHRHLERASHAARIGRLHEGGILPAFEDMLTALPLTIEPRKGGALAGARISFR